MRLALLVVVLLASCEPAERCCEMLFPNRPSAADVLDGYGGRMVYDERDMRLALSDENVRRIVVADRITVTAPFVIPERAEGLVISATRAVPFIAGRGSISALFEVRASRVLLEGVRAIRGRSGGVFDAVVTDGGYGPDDVHVEGFVVGMGGVGKRFIATTGNCARWKVVLNDYDNEGQTAPVLDVDNGTGWYVSGNRFDSGARFGGGMFNRLIGNHFNAGGVNLKNTDGGNIVVGNTGTGGVVPSETMAAVDRIDLNN